MTTYVPVDDVGAFLSTDDKSTFEAAIEAAADPCERETAISTYADKADGHWGTVKP